MNLFIFFLFFKCSSLSRLDHASGIAFTTASLLAATISCGYLLLFCFVIVEMKPMQA